MPKKLKVVQTEDENTPTEVVAASVVAISEGLRRLRAGRLNDRALVLLIQHAAPAISGGRRVGAAEVRAVLEGMESLEATFLKKA